MNTVLNSDYLDWPSLPQLLPVSIPGVQTKRDDFLIDIDQSSLVERITRYFDPKLSYEEFSTLYPEAVQQTKRYDPRDTRVTLIKRGLLPKNVVRYCYRAFDNRWVYWEPQTKLLGEKSPDFFPNALPGNLWLEAREKQTQEEFDRGTVSSVLADNFGNGFSTFFPRQLDDGHGELTRFNVPQSLVTFLADRDLPLETIFSHVVAIMHSPAYRAENRDALRMTWPRIPLPESSSRLRASAICGNRLSPLLDVEVAAPRVTTGNLRPLMPVLAVATTVAGKQMDSKVRSISAGWGRKQKSKAGMIVMPGRECVTNREYSDAELAATKNEAAELGITLNSALKILGGRTYDVYLNADAYWANVPERVWNYTLGGYQVIKKWLSYRELSVLNRPLTIDEIAYVSEMARRIAAILLMAPELDANYVAAKADALDWNKTPASKVKVPA
ncbi:MAG: type ISP restriction/modification enzyme [Reyranellaceae bacterium]